MKRRVWACNCPICKLLVHKVINRVASGGYVKNVEEKANVETVLNPYGEELTEEISKKIGNRPVEIIKLSEINQEKTQTVPQHVIPTSQQATQQTASSSSQSSTGEAGEKEEREKEETKQVKVQVPSEVMEKISTLEKEVAKIKKYVKASVDGIKATLVDLRSAMAEMSNPFNILRKYADIFFGGERGKEQASLGNVQNTKVATQQVQQQLIPVVQYPVVQYALPQQSVQTVKPVEAHKEVKKEQEKSKEGREEEKKSRINLDLYIRLVEWVNKITKHVPPDVLERLISNYVDIGVIDKNIGHVLKKIIKTVNELKSLNLDVNEQAKYLQELIQALGLTNGDVIQKVLPATEKAEKKMTQELLELIDN